MLDRVGKEVVAMLVAIALGYLFGGPVICLALAAMIALVLWTPLRYRLGIPPAKQRYIGLEDPVSGQDNGVESAPFETTHGGLTIVDDLTLRGYDQISRVESGEARFTRVNAERESKQPQKARKRRCRLF
jgi:hypothetical protein